MSGAKVKGSHFTHLLSANKEISRGEFTFQISNNEGRVNGWIGTENIFGKILALEGQPI
ncbi:MAG TPA: hypothetical protein VG944_13940 [Fimbriimonas sp.]|nr:hypothetical protein [Fimbriimonas sp.]